MTRLYPIALVALAGCQFLPTEPKQEKPKSKQSDFRTYNIERSTRKHPRPAADSPSTITVINKNEIQGSGARFLTDVLRLVPAVEVQRSSSTESNVSVRGYNDTSAASQGMIAIVDGRNVYNDFLGTVLWDPIAVFLDDIEQIEVVRGAGSFAHGANAMHGLVNIVTRSPLQYVKDQVSIQEQVGTPDSAVGALTFVRRGDESALKATIAHDDIEHFDDSVDFPSKKRFLELRYETMLDSDPDHTLDITGGITQQNFELLVGQLPPSISGTRYRSQLQDSFANAHYTYHDLEIQASWTGFDTASAPLAIYQPFSVDVDTVNTELQYSTDTVAGHRLTFGSGYRFVTFDTSELNVSQGRHDTHAGWIFAQDEWQIANKLVLTAGLRWDQHSVTDAVFSPRAGLVWEMSKNQYGRISYGTGFRRPSLRELWFDMDATDPSLPGPVTINGNLALKPEKLQSLELSYSGIPADAFRGTVTGFYNQIKGLVEFESTSPTSIRPANQIDEESFGFELEAEYFFSDQWSGIADYAHAVRRTLEPGTPRNPLAPRHKANLGLRYTASTSGLSAMLWGHYFGETQLFGIDVRDYFILNGSITYAFKIQTAKARTFVRATNILDDNHKEHPDGDSLGLMFMAGLAIDW